MKFGIFVMDKKTTNMKIRTLMTAALILLSNAVSAQDKYEIDLKPGADIPGTLYGIFFEDINYGADGGLYAELIKNRSFEFQSNPLQGWKVSGNVQVMDDGPFERNPHYVRLGDPGHPQKWTVIQNEGYFGIGVRGGEEYRLSFWARTGGGNSALKAEIINPVADGNQALASADIKIIGREWTKYEVKLKPKETCGKAEFRIFLLNRRESIDIEHISLFPTDTWKGRENGMRKDLAQSLYDLHPGVFRFPGGCIVEGTDLETRYNWKNSVGPVENRPINQNRWQYTFTYRFFPDYYQSYGLGFYEYFLLSEDIGAEPLPILSCGLACQFQNNDPGAHAPVEQLDGYIQDALDLIEFANGDTTSEWGALRAEMGHPEPFNLKYIGIGNEQWDQIYPEHLEPFIKAIRAKYPKINIVGSAGPDSEGKQFDYLWPEMKRLGADLVDEHFYRPYEWFLAQGARYDNYDRKGPKVFAGEYACHAKGHSVNHFRAALMEAAFMTTIERNADIVRMATYAPLFAHIEGWQWRPDLIWFDNLRVMRTSSWHVQHLYSTYKGANVLKLTQDGHNVTGGDGIFASAVSDGDLIYVKVINTTDKARNIEFGFKGLKKNQVISGVKSIEFTSDIPDEDNTLEEPDRIAPTEETFNAEGKNIPVSIGPMTFRIFVLKK